MKVKNLVLITSLMSTSVLATDIVFTGQVTPNCSVSETQAGELQLTAGRTGVGVESPARITVNSSGINTNKLVIQNPLNWEEAPTSFDITDGTFYNSYSIEGANIVEGTSSNYNEFTEYNLANPGDNLLVVYMGGSTTSPLIDGIYKLKIVVTCVPQ